MPELLKDKYFNYDSIHRLALRIKAAYDTFQSEDFISGTMDDTWSGLELKARMRQMTVNLGRYLPDDYEKALSIMDQVITGYPEGISDLSLLCIPDFVEVYGQDEQYWDLSVAALKRYTPYASAEFAVRPFIMKQTDRMMQQMSVWTRHENEHVRRLASEGCRPALPWGQALTCFKKDPTPVFGILEQLKADPSLYVRKSVANNLNDISKTHPNLVVQTAKRWYGKNELTDWIVKHGCRTLLKKGNRELFPIFGFADADLVTMDGFILDSRSVAIGDDITFSFQVEALKAARVRLEYGIDYVKANGSRNRKIFQISERVFEEKETKSYTKKHSFADATTRKHYPGTHSITVIVNGVEQGTLDFEVGRRG